MPTSQIILQKCSIALLLVAATVLVPAIAGFAEQRASAAELKKPPGKVTATQQPNMTWEINLEKVNVQKRMAESAPSFRHTTAKEIQEMIAADPENFKRAEDAKDMAERLEGAASNLMVAYLRASTKWPPAVQELTQQKIVQYAGQSAELYRSLDMPDKEIMACEIAETLSLATPAMMQRHFNLLSDPRVDPYQVGTSGITLGICYSDNDEPEKALKTWLVALSVCRESIPDASLFRLIADSYRMRCNFADEERYRRMAVAHDVCIVIDEYEPEMRRDVLLWQRSLQSAGKLKEAAAVGKVLTQKQKDVRSWFEDVDLSKPVSVSQVLRRD